MQQMYENSFQQLPPGIGQMQKLYRLDADRNALTVRLSVNQTPLLPLLLWLSVLLRPLDCCPTVRAAKLR
jgi:hypothetical protein